MTDSTASTPASPSNPPPGTDRSGAWSRFLTATELDTRLIGMVAALALIWVGFHMYGAIVNNFGAFLTPRNLWNLSVQTSSIGIMATGMVLVIITRHIDLSVGSILGFCAIVMGMLQVYILPPILGLGHPLIWIIAVLAGILSGAIIGAFQGSLIAYGAIPAFIVTLGGLLVWRGAAFLIARGETISPVDSTFALLGGGPYGAVGATGSWIVGLIVCGGIIFGVLNGRRQRTKFQFKQRPVWADSFLALLGCGATIGAVILVNSYYWPRGIVNQWAAANDVVVPETGLQISYGFAIPVLILAVVAVGMNFLLTRTRFGRYVFAIGGNPEAAALAGIDTKWMTVKIFAIMGGLAGLASVVASARLNSATNALGTLDELYVIAAAVIGGTSLAGGVGTIFGAILGALVMQSLQSGMVLIGFDAGMQQVVVGSVLVLAVFLDILYRRKSK
ncbi:D-xylose transport system permease protein [Loktanella sp. DSM 29012]|uniref:sugar ABC transporter permease n=1 Tax=Loktanella sp. DSM 29012 TaxID=1881056 RepID=UPI0008D4B3F8|nr:sugar ABC transporter permease [Loktanella sp. DSM 29012]SEQ53173.1 D-xylose transport system permease protein [Loktanella sp. DSM 29012]